MDIFKASTKFAERVGLGPDRLTGSVVKLDLSQIRFTGAATDRSRGTVHATNTHEGQKRLDRWNTVGPKVFTVKINGNP